MKAKLMKSPFIIQNQETSPILIRYDQNTGIGLKDICLLHQVRLDKIETALFLSRMLEVRTN